MSLRFVGSQFTPDSCTIKSCVIAFSVIIVSLIVAEIAHAQAPLPRVVSTNLCADILALELAHPEQLLSVSYKSQDPQLSPFALAAQKIPANRASAEEIIALRPDIVLVSRNWRSHHDMTLFERHDIEVMSIPYPSSWEEIFESTRSVAAKLQRPQIAESLLADTQRRLDLLRDSQRPFSMLYLRPNGGTAGAKTYVDTVLNAVGVVNHATAEGRVGWGRLALEQLLINPPDIFMLGEFARDEAWAKAAFSRHPLIQELFSKRPVVHLKGNYWGCSNWLLINVAEDIAKQLDTIEQQMNSKASTL